MTPDEPVVGSDKELVPYLLRVIAEKTPTKTVEVGFDEHDERRWWAKAILRSGRVRTAEVTADDPRLGAVMALAELARELGLSVRVHDPVYIERKEPPE